MDAPEEQAALTADMAELCELGSAAPAVDGEVEEPAMEAPPQIAISHSGS